SMAAYDPDAIPFCCTLDGAAVNYKGDADKLVQRFVKAFGKALGKKNIALAHEPDMNRAAVRIRFVQIEQGSQLLRYLLPFLSPAFVEMEVDLCFRQGAPESLHY